jgi:hypothetical protein
MDMIPEVCLSLGHKENRLKTASYDYEHTIDGEATELHKQPKKISSM